MKIRSALVATAFMLSASVAGAEPTWTVLSPSGGTETISVGDTITIDLGLSNPAGAAVQGVTGVLSGIDPAVLQLDSGETALHHFTGFCSPTNCFAGIDSADNDFFNPADLTENYGGGATLTVVQALALNTTSNTGTNDPGLDGALDSPSDRDVSLTFTALSEGVVSLSAGGEYSDGTDVLPITGVPVTITVPEPGALAASLAGLGAVLAVVGLRRRS